MSKQEATKTGAIAKNKGNPVRGLKKKKKGTLRLPGMMKSLTAGEIVDKALDELCGPGGKKRRRNSKR